MKVIDEFNDVSEQIKPKKLGKNDFAEYQLLGGIPDPLRPGHIIYPMATRISTNFRIWDPWKISANGTTGDYVDVGLVKSVDKDKNITTEASYFDFQGKKGFRGTDSIRDQELYEILELSNQNLSNPNRDQSVTPLFKRIDEVKDAKGAVAKRSVKLEALTYVGNMNEASIREFAAAMNWNEMEDLDVLQNKVGEFAEKEPQKFINFVDEPGTKDKTLIKNALTKGIISYDTGTNKVHWAKTSTAVIANLDREDGKTWVDLFAEWIRTNKNGDNIMTSIKKQINAEIKEKVNAAKAVEA